MDGIFLVDKPIGWTSFDIVAKVRSSLRTISSPKTKVGHSGTLDPLASGLLIILIGSYTKRAQTLTKLDKTYTVSMHLGITSTTGDGEGIKTKQSDKRPTKLELEKTMSSFKGVSEQIPPIYSAIKIGGQPAYKLARRGVKPDLKPRKIEVYSLRLTKYQYPNVTFTVDVSSGTYIRSLVTDMGNALGVGAYTIDLRRQRIGAFDIKDAISPSNLTVELIRQKLILL